MILDFYIEELEEAEELDEILLKRKDEIGEDLSIKIYLTIKVDGEYENFEIEHYLDEDDDVEKAIDRVISLVEKEIEKCQ